VNLGTRVIANHTGSDARQWLHQRGFETVNTDMTEFMKSGGAAKCLSLRLDEPFS
jgi:N-dimethylarginine dimethylaminohydrolase